MDAEECMGRLDAIAQFLEHKGELSITPIINSKHNQYSLAGKVSIPCLAAGKYAPKNIGAGSSPVLEIPITIDDIEIGFLCLTSKIHEAEVDPWLASDNIKHSLIKICSATEFDATRFDGSRPNLDCIVALEDHIQTLTELLPTSAAWGGFVPCEEALPIATSVNDAESSVIKAERLLPARTNRHKLALQRATESSIAIDRFLHLYHFLELDFDHELVKRIKATDIENTTELNRILSRGRDELDRLHLVLEEFVDFNALESIFSSLQEHNDVAINVFYEYGKEHNPLKDRKAFEALFATNPSVTFESLKKIKERDKLNVKFTATQDEYYTAMIKLASYWVYRIRCCIAHNKIGEYHMQTPEDMRFVSEFGEPLVRILISHRLRKI